MSPLCNLPLLLKFCFKNNNLYKCLFFVQSRGVLWLCADSPYEGGLSTTLSTGLVDSYGKALKKEV